MAYKGASTVGNKRKFANGSKDSSFTKKPKFDKRAPVEKEDDEVPSDNSNGSDLSDQEDGGVILNDKNSHDNGDAPKRARANGDESSTPFEKGSSQLYVIVELLTYNNI